MTKLIAYFESLNKILDDMEINEILNSYNNWVKYQPSIIDNNSDISRPHHVRNCNNAGWGCKPNDLWQVPITYKQHTQYHSGEKSLYQDIFIKQLPALHDRFIEETELYWLKHRIKEER